MQVVEEVSELRQFNAEGGGWFVELAQSCDIGESVRLEDVKKEEFS
jgi:hypothetical protein